MHDHTNNTTEKGQGDKKKLIQRIVIVALIAGIVLFTSRVVHTSDEPPPAGADREFTTDFSKHSVPYSEILSGGPPKDGIPAVDTP